ncbi:MAG: 3,4-dihydroxy-2-butanone-4-phosphate synthase [Xanthomonadales bacterium]|nr:3,4-dihydroxy-2-butanone-4-phosphate synthase [Xanthomonadales bacterium]
MQLNTIEELIEDIRRGKMVILMDDEDRENEGDLIMAASMVRPEDINFMARHGRGLICMPMTKERCEQLNIPLMSATTDAAFSTNFTVTIEAAEGITTGISAYDRALTIRTAVKPDAVPKDLTQPGHIFPIMAKPGGVLSRAGHTEASVDLALLAGLEPAAAIVEILNEDGSMARRPELEIIAREHDLKIGTIADLIHFRMKNGCCVERVSEQQVSTAEGEFQLLTYRDTIEHKLHMVMMQGQPQAEDPFLVRVHVRNTLSDVLGVQRDDLGMPLRLALAEIAAAGSGMVLVLGGDEDPESLLYRLQELPPPAMEASGDNRSSRELRNYGIGAQIIADVGVHKMRVLGAPIHLSGLSGFDLEVVEYVDPATLAPKGKTQEDAA